MSENGATNGAINGTPPPGAFEEPARQPKKQLTPEEMVKATREMRIANKYHRSLMESRTLMEAYGAFGWDSSQGFGGSDTTEFYLRMRSQAGGLAIPPSQPGDRRYGRKWPMFATDVELARLRQASRVLCASNDFAKAMLRNQVNFTIGKGFSYRSVPKNEKPFVPDEDADQETNEKNRKEYLIRKKGIQKIVDAVQAWLDDFCARNNWNTAAESNDVAEDGSVGSASSTREREAHCRVDRDGETIIRLFCHEDGKVEVRFVGPEMVYGYPNGMGPDDGWTFGMQHLIVESEDESGHTSRFEDLERICNYYIRPHALGHQPKDKEHDSSGEIVPAREIVHIKDPWEDAEVKRGTPVFAYDTFDALMRASNLIRNVSITSSVQAATAEIWKHNIGTQAQIQTLQNGPNSRTITDGSGASFVEQRIRPGSIRRVPQGQEPVPDPATTQVPNYLAAAAADLRQAGAGASMAEYMISADSSNSNYASTQEAGTPYVRSAESRQEHYKTAFLRLMWRVIRHAVKCRRLPEEALTLIAIHVEGMEIAKNNERELSMARTANLQAKVTSPQIEIAKLGNDVAQVKADWKEWDKDMAPPQQPGQPQPGQPSGAPAQPQPGSSDEEEDDPLAGVPEADLSGEFKPDEKVADAKRSQAAKEGWAKRAHEGEAQESLLEAATDEPGFTGIDSHGHKWQNGKQEAIAKDQAGEKSGPTNAKLNGETVKVTANDKAHGLAKVETPTGEKVVKTGELEVGYSNKAAAKPFHEMTRAQYSAHVNPQEAKKFTDRYEAAAAHLKAIDPSLLTKSRKYLHNLALDDRSKKKHPAIKEFLAASADLTSFNKMGYDTHRKAIAGAIAKGVPVPPEVLDEFAQYLNANFGGHSPGSVRESEESLAEDNWSWIRVPAEVLEAIGGR